MTDLCSVINGGENKAGIAEVEQNDLLKSYKCELSAGCKDKQQESEDDGSATGRLGRSASSGSYTSSEKSSGLLSSSFSSSSWDVEDYVDEISKQKEDVDYETDVAKLNSGRMAVKRCLRACLKAAAVGVSVRGGLAAISIASQIVTGKKNRYQDLIQKANRELKEALRYGLFCGSFASIFSTMDEIIAQYSGKKRFTKWRALIAGLVAGPSLLLTGKTNQHISLAIYLLLQATVLIVRCGMKSVKVGWLFDPFRWKHGDTFLMCLSSSQILYSWVLHPKSLPASYISFLNKHGGKPTPIVRGIQDVVLGNPLTTLSLISDYYKSKGSHVQLDANMRVPCSIIHGNQDCVSHIFSFLGPSYLRSLSVYAPVYLIPAIIGNHKTLLKRPFNFLAKALLQTARSSTFLSIYCASAWIFSCALFRAAGKCGPALLATSTFPTGLALLIEKKGRRMDIALYCFARALESFAICVSDSGVVPHTCVQSMKHIDVILFSCATAIIMHCYAQERAVFQSRYLQILDWVFGIPHCKAPIFQSL